MYKILIFILLTIPPIVFFTDLTRNPYYFQIVFLNALTLFIWIWFLLKGLIAKKITLKTSNIDLPLFVFFSVATFSWLFNFFENYSDVFLRFSSYSEGLKRWLFFLVNAILVYHIPINLLDEEFKKKTFGVLFFVGFIAAFYGILQFLGIEFVWPRLLNPFGGRSVSTFGNPNFLSSYLVILLPILFAYYINAKKSSDVIFYFIYIFTYMTSLVVTLTRSSWLGAFGGLVLFFALLQKELIYRSKKRLIVLGAFVALLVFFWPHPKSVEKYTPAIFERLIESKDYATKVYAPAHQRQLIWSCAWNMIVEMPLIGRGWGLFELFFPFYQGRYLFFDIYRTLRTHANNAHNEILEIWSQTGIIGFGVYIWLICTLFVSGFKIWKSASGFQKTLSLALSAGIFGMLIDNLLNVSIHFAVPAFLYWWVVGVLMSIASPRIREIQIKNMLSKSIVFVLILAGVIFIIRYYKNFMGEINYFSGFKLSKRGEVRSSMEYLERAHKYQRFEVNNNYELGNTYARLGMKEKAIWAYKEALKANTGYDEIFFNMATVYNQMGDRSEAEKNYSMALGINPLSFDTYMALGAIYMNDIEKNSNRAISLFEQAHNFFPDNKDIINNLGYLYTRTNQPKRAIDFYKMAIEIDPEFLMARKNLETLLRQQGASVSFLTEYDKLMEQLGRFIEKQDWSSAIGIAEKIAEKYPGSFKGRFYLANLYFTAGDFYNAEKIYKELIQSQPGNATLLSNLALMYEKQNRSKEARSVWERVKQIDPTNKMAVERLK